MTIKRSVQLASVVIVILLACLFFSLYRASAGLKEMERAQDIRFRSAALAVELAKTSADLTNNVRVYALTSDPETEEAYWDIIAVRDGKKPRPAYALVAPGQSAPLLDLIKELGLPEEESVILRRALDKSNNLVPLEAKAMDAVKGKAASENGLSGKELAASLVFGDGYRKPLLEIQDDMLNFQHIMSKRTAAAVEEIRTAEDFNVLLLTVITALTGALVLCALYLIIAKLARPVVAGSQYAQAVSNGDLDAELEVPICRNEIGTLLRSLQTMVRALKERLEEANEQKRKIEIQAEETRVALHQARTIQERMEKNHKLIMETADSVAEVSGTLTKASERLSAVITDATRAMERTGDRTNAVTRSMGEMSDSILNVAHTTSRIAEAAADVRKKAENGSVIMEKTVESIIGAQNDTGKLKNAVEGLGKQAEAIGNIIVMITDIADQTNLLALNAAIEAARAGDAGRGFAVVADEVRKLAEKTMQATKQVEDAIVGVQNSTHASIKEVDNTVERLEGTSGIANQSKDALNEIANLTIEAADRFQSIAAATEEQSRNGEAINHSLEEISGASRETVNAMQGASDAVSALTEQAYKLQSLVKELRGI